MIFYYVVFCVLIVAHVVLDMVHFLMGLDISKLWKKVFFSSVLLCFLAGMDILIFGGIDVIEPWTLLCLFLVIIGVKDLK